MATSPYLSQKDLAQKIEHDLSVSEARVRTAVEGVDASRAFACYSLYRMADKHKDRPSSHSRPTPAAVELAAWVLYPEFGKCATRNEERVQLVLDALELHSNKVALSEAFHELPEQEGYDQLAVHLSLHSGIVRGSAYPQQIIRRIKGLLLPFELELASRVGIGPCRACEVLKTLGTLIEENINKMRAEFHEKKARGKSLERTARGRTEEGQAELAELGREMKQIVDGMEGDWIPSWAQVSARLPGFTRSEWDSLQNIVGLTPERRASLTRLVDIQDYPIFFLNNERAFYVGGAVCYDAVFNFFDDLARTTISLRDRYGLRVAQWMEEQIQDDMQRLFPPAVVIRNACFPDPDHPGGEAESDLVIVWGPFLVIAEAKGKRIPREAMRGNQAKLKSTLRENIQAAFFQALRVVRALERTTKLQFKERTTGRMIEVDSNRLLRVMPISVTLQHFSGIPTQLALASKLGLFKGRAYPWSVSIDDLDVITRFAGSPDAFLHYINRRIEHQLCKVGFQGDELDIFAHYLDNRLHPNIYQESKEIAGHQGTVNISFNGGAERFEPFNIAEYYEKPPPTEVVELKVPPHVRAVLSELRSRQDDGSRWIAFTLLGLSPYGLAKLEDAFTRIRSFGPKDRKISRITFKDHNVVVTVMGHRGISEDDFQREVFIRNAIEKYRYKTLSAVAIGIDFERIHKPFHTGCWEEGEWARDPVYEKLIAEDRSELLITGSVPGRNAPCPCGSGLKFKKCCLSKTRL